MEVTKIPPFVNQPFEKKNETIPTGKAGERGVGVKESPVAQDRVQLSDKCHEVDSAKKVTMQREDIRTEKVEQLRQAIKSGTYVVEPEKLAEKMLGEVW